MVVTYSNANLRVLPLITGDLIPPISFTSCAMPFTCCAVSKVEAARAFIKHQRSINSKQCESYILLYKARNSRNDHFCRSLAVSDGFVDQGYGLTPMVKVVDVVGLNIFLVCKVRRRTPHDSMKKGCIGHRERKPFFARAGGGDGLFKYERAV